jgi:hypothetical protein
MSSPGVSIQRAPGSCPKHPKHCGWLPVWNDLSIVLSLTLQIQRLEIFPYLQAKSEPLLPPHPVSSVRRMKLSEVGGDVTGPQVNFFSSSFPSVWDKATLPNAVEWTQVRGQCPALFSSYGQPCVSSVSSELEVGLWSPAKVLGRFSATCTQILMLKNHLSLNFSTPTIVLPNG